jgi:DNA-binding GntR family transcriptional regulator
LHRLVHEGWLTAVPNKGTFVPSLTVEEMRNIYDVRSMLEEGIVRRLSDALGAPGLKRLKAHVQEEKQAIKTDDRARLFRLSGEFHVLLAELCGNEELTRLLRGLLTRATMHFSLAVPRQMNNCAGPHDHGDIVEAIQEGKAEKASRLMLAHLAGLIELQSARPPTAKSTDLAEAFRGL